MFLSARLPRLQQLRPARSDVGRADFVRMASQPAPLSAPRWSLFGSCLTKRVVLAGDIDLVAEDVPEPGFDDETRQALEAIACEHSKTVEIFLDPQDNAFCAKLRFVPRACWTGHEVDANGIPTGWAGRSEPSVRVTASGTWLATDAYCGRDFFEEARPMTLRQIAGHLRARSRSVLLVPVGIMSI